MTIAYVPLPTSDFVFGVGHRDHHVVTHEAAARALAFCGDDPRIASAPALCYQLVGLATAWGPYSRAEAARRPGRCADCAWILALHNGEVADEITSRTTRNDADAATIANAVGAALIGQRLLTAIVRDPELVHGDHRLARSHQSQVLAQASRHLPVVTVCEECAETGASDAHDDNQPCGKAICPGCTLAATGSWAGEWEGTLLVECTVAVPCSVLTTIAAHYQIPIGVIGH
jgi:hypothetical protein